MFTSGPPSSAPGPPPPAPAPPPPAPPEAIDKDTDADLMTAATLRIQAVARGSFARRASAHAFVTEESAAASFFGHRIVMEGTLLMKGALMWGERHVVVETVSSDPAHSTHLKVSVHASAVALGEGRLPQVELIAGARVLPARRASLMGLGGTRFPFELTAESTASTSVVLSAVDPETRAAWLDALSGAGIAVEGGTPAPKEATTTANIPLMQGTLSLKRTLAWSERYVVVETLSSEDAAGWTAAGGETGALALEFYASAAAFKDGKEWLAREYISSVRELPSARRASLVWLGGGTRFPFELLGGTMSDGLVLSASDPETRAAWLDALCGAGAALAAPVLGWRAAQEAAAAAAHEAEVAAVRRAASEEEEEAAETRRRWLEEHETRHGDRRIDAFRSRFGTAQLEACRAAIAAAAGGSRVTLERVELLPALASLGLQLQLEELTELVAQTDTDGDGQTNLPDFLDIVTRCKTVDAAHKLARAVRRVGSKHGMQKAVEKVLLGLQSTSELLLRGLEVLKFPRSGKPALRVLWLQSDGTLCLDTQRSESKPERAIRLEHIGEVTIGAAHSVFQKSPKKSTLVDGKEKRLISIHPLTGCASVWPFHFSVSSEAVAAALAEKIKSVKTMISLCPTADARRAQAVHYATTGTFKRELSGRSPMMRTPAAAASPPAAPGADAEKEDRAEEGAQKGAARSLAPALEAASQSEAGEEYLGTERRGDHDSE